ncbi:MAG: hypothetical protein B6226_00210 [Candidatus Cloacimonetes bacterium 4572_65]|nr:MAG: hypothetical protein B6226_00210 [Candidatus Cloacimonetes bacterium 4572_65]
MENEYLVPAERYVGSKFIYPPFCLTRSFYLGLIKVLERLPKNVFLDTLQEVKKIIYKERYTIFLLLWEVTDNNFRIGTTTTQQYKNER